MNKLIIAIFISCITAVTYAHEPAAQPDHVSVTGIGEIEAEPDQAILNIGINAQRPNLAEAKRVADEQYASVLKVIKQAGIDDRKVKSTRMSAQPQYEWRTNQRVYKGELVSRSLRITIEDLDKVSPLMQALVENGVSTIDGMSTGFKDRKALEQQALGAAAEDARNKAEYLAKQLGRTLGTAYMITEQIQDGPPVFQRDMQMATRALAESAAPPPEMFGTEKVRARIMVRFNLL